MDRRRTSLILGSILREKGRILAGRLVAKKYGSVEKAVDSILEGITTPYRIGEILSDFQIESVREKENEC